MLQSYIDNLFKSSKTMFKQLNQNLHTYGSFSKPRNKNSNQHIHSVKTMKQKPILEYRAEKRKQVDG